MLINTFCHISGIGPKTEMTLWNAGLTNWRTALQPEGLAVSEKQAALVKREARASMEELELENAAYFVKRLSSHSHWRLFPEFRDHIAYLDIETNGMDSYGGVITTIALYDGSDIFYYVNGRNLEAFVEDIQRFKILVTYNGKTFDIPFIEQYFRIKLDQAQIDLRYVLASLGYKGGLKRCEKALGIDRGFLHGIDGFFAPLLWQEYDAGGNERALETLLAYNIEDTVNLEALMVMAYNLKISSTPFANTHQLPEPIRPAIPFQPDLLTIENVKRRVFAWQSGPYAFR